MFDHRSHRRTSSARNALIVFLILTFGLAGCSAVTDSEETAEGLSEVKKDPSQPQAAEELDAIKEPAPVVDPLECSPYLVITVRGTGEPHRKQLLSPVARLISDSRPEQVTTVDLDYPATGKIKEGATLGIRTLIDTLNQQADLCPDQDSLVLGYSQGALVIGESLISPQERLLGETVGELTPEASENIAAILLYADPRFVGSDPFGAGDYNPRINGLLERPEGSFDAYVDRTRSYCVANDFICQSNAPLDEEGHVAYYSNGMQQDGAAFVITRMGELTQPNESPEQSLEQSQEQSPE